MAGRASRIITMGCDISEACPADVVASEDWALDDPSGRPLDEVRRVRDEIERRVRRLLEEMGAS